MTQADLKDILDQTDSQCNLNRRSSAGRRDSPSVQRHRLQSFDIGAMNKTLYAEN